MKKFYDKITKQQWRVTIPNLKAGAFKKSPTEAVTKPKKSRKTLSGSYDVQAAESKHKRSQSVPNGIVVTTAISAFESSDTSDTETEENYEDALTMSKINLKCSREDILAADGEIYAQPNEAGAAVVLETSKNLTDTNSRYEYDVPKISFSFFERLKSEEEIHNEYQVVVAKSVRTSTPKARRKSEVTITLAVPEPDLSNSETDMSHSDLKDFVDDAKASVLVKSGSDPNLSLRNEDDELYKVPRSHNHCYRLSQSLNDFNEEAAETITTAHSSVEHISCSQVIVQCAADKINAETNELVENNSMDYCKTRSKLPLVSRRITLLRKPKTKAVDTWMNLRSKVNDILTEHAAQQRVGAFDTKEKISINLDSMYKSSKRKCKKALKSTSKMFTRSKKNQENLDPNSDDTSSQMVKNDAFFAKVELKASDIEYMFDKDDSGVNKENSDAVSDSVGSNNKIQILSRSVSEEKKDEFDFSTLKHAFRRSRIAWEGQNGFDDLRRYVKQGGDFCKELSTILQERAEAETQYAKSLSKLSNKLARACRENVGGLNEAWRAVAVELEARAEGHRLIGTALLEEAARPLRNLTENQHRARKQAETSVDKAARGLADWRAAEAKSKKHSHVCARDNEKLQDASLDAKYGKMTLSRSTSLIQLAHLHNHKAVSDKESAKLEGKKRKAEDAVKKADIEYYTLCVRAERARLEWESAVLHGTSTFQSLEEERLNNLKSVLTTYLQHSTELCPRLSEATEKLKEPIAEAEPSKDLTTFVSLRQSSQQIAEQLLPDFYCEHITLAMNRERRKQALVKLLHLIRQDIERERKSKNGLENLSKAIKQTPNFGAEDSQQSVTEKLYHMKSMLTYLEGARYKVQSALAELDSRPRAGHPLAPHITITRDKSGLQQSVLKVPQWLRDEWIEPEKSPLSEKSSKSDLNLNEVDLPDPDWTDRGTADGNSNQPDSDFDEFSSQGSSTEGSVCNTEETAVEPIAKCKALYTYTPNLPDELALRPGDVLSVYRQQDDGWWLGECNGLVGIFPATYVETIPASNNN